MVPPAHPPRPPMTKSQSPTAVLEATLRRRRLPPVERRFLTYQGSWPARNPALPLPDECALPSWRPAGVVGIRVWQTRAAAPGRSFSRARSSPAASAAPGATAAVARPSGSCRHAACRAARRRHPCTSSSPPAATAPSRRAFRPGPAHRGASPAHPGAWQREAPTSLPPDWPRAWGGRPSSAKPTGRRRASRRTTTEAASAAPMEPSTAHPPVCAAVGRWPSRRRPRSGLLPRLANRGAWDMVRRSWAAGLP